MSSVFTLQIANFVKKAKGNADLVVRRTVLGVGTSLVEKSPVDTGRFRANWQHDIGQIDTSTTEDFDPSGEAAIAAMRASIDSHEASGQVHYLSNSLPYAIPLENGHSKQSPLGMAAITVAEFDQFINAAVSSVSK